MSMTFVRFVHRELPDSRFEFWTADGYLWTHDGKRVACDAALLWYRDERARPELVDLGGEA